jgi:hypothetical protein
MTDWNVQMISKPESIDMLDEINDSYQGVYDRHEPWLLLYSYCMKEYMIPGYQLT